MHLLVLTLCALSAAEDADAGGMSLEDEVAALKARVSKLEGDATAPQPADAGAPAEPASPSLDAREPPFATDDWTWLNGSNYQPDSLLRFGHVTATFFVDADYAWQFSNPVDHTIFPTTTAPRHSEFNLNLAYLGFELNGIDTPYGGPIGRIEAQYGSYIATIQGQDATVARGYYLSNPALSYVKQVGVGWHFHVLHGLNIEAGIFPSYIALESYVPQENWNYTHPFVSDFTPYYFAGLRTQLFPSDRFKIELWLVNGWQSFGRWHDAITGGYLLNWRPGPHLSLTHTLYVGQEQTRASDPTNNSLRVYTDNYVQLLVYDHLERTVLQRIAFCLVADAGYEYRGPTAGTVVNGVLTPPNGPMAGASLTGRIEWTRWLMSTLRGDIFYDFSSAVVSPRRPAARTHRWQRLEHRTRRVARLAAWPLRSTSVPALGFWSRASGRVTSRREPTISAPAGSRVPMGFRSSTMPPARRSPPGPAAQRTIAAVANVTCCDCEGERPTAAPSTWSPKSS